MLTRTEVMDMEPARPGFNELENKLVEMQHLPWAIVRTLIWVVPCNIL